MKELNTNVTFVMKPSLAKAALLDMSRKLIKTEENKKLYFYEVMSNKI